MDDLISRQAAIEAIEGLHDCYNGFSDTYDKACIIGVLEEIPPTDVTEVIRCKDCKHFEHDHAYLIQGIPVLGHEVCNAWGDGCKTDENGYCFMAERRNDGEIH